MEGVITKLLVVVCIAMPLINTVAAVDGVDNYLDVETPTFFNYNSPLKQPDSLRSRPYYDFLSTLYRRDATKSDLFRPYARSRRAVPVEQDAPAVPAQAVHAVHAAKDERSKRAIVFRPLFVYKQQQIRKQEIQRKRV